MAVLHDGQAADDLVGSLLRAHGVALVRLALLLVGDQAAAENVVQDGFLALHRAPPGLRDHDEALARPLVRCHYLVSGPATAA